MSFDVSFEHRRGRFQFALKRDALMLIGGVCLSAGLGALAAPWWYPLVALALGLTGVTLEPATNWLIGGPLVLIGLGCLGLKTFVFDPRAARRAADKSLVAARPPSPQALSGYFDGLTTDDAFWSSADSAFQAEYTLYAAKEHQLLDKRTSVAFAAFKAAAERLHHFAGQHFDWFPAHQVNYADHRYCLAPHLNVDRGLPAPNAQKEAEYAALQAELDARVKAARNAYAAFVTRLRELGHI